MLLGTTEVVRPRWSTTRLAATRPARSVPARTAGVAADAGSVRRPDPASWSWWSSSTARRDPAPARRPLCRRRAVVACRARWHRRRARSHTGPRRAPDPGSDATRSTSSGARDLRSASTSLPRGRSRPRSRRLVGRARVVPTSPRRAPAPANATGRSHTSGARSTAATRVAAGRSERTAPRHGHRRRRSGRCRAPAATRPTRERRPTVEGRRRNRNAGDADPPGDCPSRGGHEPPGAAGDGDEPADGELPHPRRQEIEGSGGVGASHPPTDDERDDRDGDHHHRDQPAVATRPAVQGQQRQRPEQVELLLDRAATRSAAAERASVRVGRRSSRRAVAAKTKLTTKPPAATASVASGRWAIGASNICEARTVTTTTTHEAGSRRRARRAQNRGNEIVPVVVASRSNSLVIRKPDSTKNTSTPTNPPENREILAWNKMTAMTATARRPSMSGRNVVVDHARLRRRWTSSAIKH